MEDIKDYLKNDIPLQNYETKYNQQYHKTNTHISFYCSIWKCRKCHPELLKLSKAEIQAIREKIAARKKPRNLKRCNHTHCPFCESQVEITNKYITEFNANLMKEQELKKAVEMDIVEEPQRKEMQEGPNPINKQSELHNISNFTTIKVKGDENCLPNLEENHH